jgi:predicted ATPase with chaperone activity
MDEAELGYPHHRWLAVGHLAEAESESLREQPALAREIRACRIEIMQNKRQTTCIEELIRKACILAGDTADLQDSPLNSKVFETRLEGAIL